MMIMLLLLIPVSQHASGMEVEVYDGVESVLLPCQLPADVSSDFLAAVWDREELKDPTVHVRLQSGDDFKDQNVRYTNRTSLRADALQTGDLSLTLRNPTVSDSGNYTCNTRVFRGNQSQIDIQLKVTEPPAVWPIVLLAVLDPVVLLAAGFGVFIYHRYKMMKSRKVYPVEMVEVKQGEESVQLSFQITEEKDVPLDVKVAWRHQNTTVHVYKNGGNQSLLKDQNHRDRTEMNEDPLRIKDFSLKLKDPQLSDRGIYTCTVYDRNADILLQKVVTLSVRVPEVVEVVKGMQSVILPFTTEVLKLQDVTVEWKHEDKKVHVRQNGRNQSHDQEVNQEPVKNGNLQHTDDGTYTCTVYSEGEEILLQKVVSITVRVYPVEMVNATQGEKSILLPFKVTDHLPQDVKVEWRLINPEDRMVYVYERSKNESPSRDHVYRGRAEMDEDPLNTKDLSLTLKDLRLTDSGVYTCTVYNKDGHMLLQKVVTLSVRDYPLEMVEVTQGEASVLLPFKITEDLLEDIKVEWKHQNIIVHVYQNSQNQSLLMDEDYKGRTEMNEGPLKNKDLSLTLKGLQLSDHGGYTCTVYNKDGSILLQKVVTLSVRGYQTEMVEVMEGEGFVLLPFKITADLPRDIKAEWRLTHPEEKMVHVYESGNNLSDEDDQEQVYSSRTEMNEDPVTTKDLSLILKDLHLTDSGVYTCTVYNKYGYKLLQKSVTLSVRDRKSDIKVEDGGHI
ncbi:uncharacterized protein LOC109194439 [Oreochromis niloticus]|uniref:uncharacterized protein LOC109194439 n=1 Tax=Oreochromis niloticus TaxID=8128 RepID=UPI000DF4C204|nr:uncharacterized protein LOC109194439 [Oreochromis niloticus]